MSSLLNRSYSIPECIPAKLIWGVTEPVRGQIQGRSDLLVHPLPVNLFEECLAIVFSPRCHARPIRFLVTIVSTDVLFIGVQDSQYSFQHESRIARHVLTMLSIFGNQMIVDGDGMFPGNPEVEVIIFTGR